MVRNNSKPKPVVDDTPTTELHLDRVISRTACANHDTVAAVGVPCWEFQAAESDTWHRGICNTRAKRAGYNGKIHPSSLDRTYGLRARA